MIQPLRACLALAAFAFATSAGAAAPMVKTQAPGYYRMMLGEFEVTAISDGTVELPVTDLLTNTSKANVEKALKSSFQKSPLEDRKSTRLNSSHSS